ncbi:hypothetical protein C8R44DRAFT_875095 [Mycena epipterygia]|nr:hypothetical protein C8R44DRAFT_875095 [Mycena epipterygia]
MPLANIAQREIQTEPSATGLLSPSPPTMEISKTVTTIVSLPGGPELNPEDIDWASDLPAGRKLLEWLVSQVQPELEDELDRTGVEFWPIRAALYFKFALVTRVALG